MNLLIIVFVNLAQLKHIFFKIEGELGETPMVVYLNVHMAIEQMRQKLEKENRKAFGPRVICFLIQQKDSIRATWYSIYYISQRRSMF